MDIVGEFEVSESQAFGVGDILGLLLGIDVGLFAFGFDEGLLLVIVVGWGVHYYMILIMCLL